jgi:hypothetical protein
MVLMLNPGLQNDEGNVSFELSLTLSIMNISPVDICGMN